MRNFVGRYALAIIILIAAAARVVASLWLGDRIEFLPGIYDQISYHTLANRLLHGYGFTFNEPWWPVTAAGQPTAHWSYLYTAFLTAFYAVFGNHPLIPRLAQAVSAGILLPWLTYRLTLRIFSFAADERISQSPDMHSRRIALIAAAWTACYGYFVYYNAALMTETFYILCILWVLDCSLRLSKLQTDFRPLAWLELGLAFTLAVLLRQLFLFFLPFLFLWLAWVFIQRRRRSEDPAHKRGAQPNQLLLGGLLSLLVMVVIIAPITIFNYRQFGQPVLLNTNAGYAFFWANHPIYGDRFIPILPSEIGTYQGLIPKELLHLNEAALDQALLKIGMGYVIADPGRYLRLSLSRIPVYFMFWPSAQSTWTSNLSRTASFGLALPFMLLGIGLWVYKVYRRRLPPEPGALLLLFAVVYTAIHLLSWALIRYRLPVDAVLLPFAGFGVYWIIGKLKSSKNWELP